MIATERCRRCGQSRAEVRAGRGRHGGTGPCIAPNSRLIATSDHAQDIVDGLNRMRGGDPRHDWLAPVQEQRGEQEQ